MGDYGPIGEDVDDILIELLVGPLLESDGAMTGPPHTET
jgi:hypothetical protein